MNSLTSNRKASGHLAMKAKCPVLGGGRWLS